MLETTTETTSSKPILKLYMANKSRPEIEAWAENLGWILDEVKSDHNRYSVGLMQEYGEHLYLDCDNNLENVELGLSRELKGDQILNLHAVLDDLVKNSK